MELECRQGILYRVLRNCVEIRELMPTRLHCSQVKDTGSVAWYQVAGCSGITARDAIMPLRPSCSVIYRQKDRQVDECREA